MEMCQVCNKLKDNHNRNEVNNCKKILNERNRHTRSWLRFRKIGEILDKYEEMTPIAIAEELEMEGIKTTHWTIDRCRREILEINPHLRWDSKMKVFYRKFARNSSLSQNKGEITSTEATTTDGNVSNLLTKDSAYLN